MHRFQLPGLNYSFESLSPALSAQTLEFHYNGHHQAYIDKLNQLIAGSGLEPASLQEVVVKSRSVLYENAAQAWNHTFYWNCLTPQSRTGDISKPFLERVRQKYGTITSMKENFLKHAGELFGSGWTWLVLDSEGQLEFMNMPNAGNPLKENKIPILTCDVWEHAYYIDYRNERAKYLEAFWEKINWAYVNKNFVSHNYDHIEEQMRVNYDKPRNKTVIRPDSSLYH